MTDLAAWAVEKVAVMAAEKVVCSERGVDWSVDEDAETGAVDASEGEDGVTLDLAGVD